MNKPKQNQYWLTSGFLSLFQNLATVFFGFATFYLLVRILNKSDFGTWALFMTITTILETIRNGLVQNPLIKFLSFTSIEEKPKIIAASFANGGILTGLFIILIAALSPYLSDVLEAPQLVPMFYIYTCVYFLSGILTHFQFIEQANFKFKGVFVSSFARQGLLFAYVGFCSLNNFKIELLHLVYVQLSAVLISTIISYFYVKPILKLSPRLNFDWMKKLFHYGKFSFGTSVSSMIFGSIDQIMLGSLVSTTAAGVYNIAIRITNLVEIPTNSISAIVFPQSARRIETDGKTAVKYLYEKSVGSIMAILIPALLFVLIFSRSVVVFLASEKYLEVVPILNIVIIYCFFIPYGRQFGTILDSMGKTALTFKIVLISALLNITLNYFFIKSYGIIGAAYATLLANTICFILGQVILKKILNVNTWNTLVFAVKFYPELFARLTDRHANKVLRAGKE